MSDDESTCPWCHGRVKYDDSDRAWICTKCGRTYTQKPLDW